MKPPFQSALPRQFLALTLIALTLSACGQPDQTADNGTSLNESMLPLHAVTEDPTYHLLDGYDPLWQEQIREGIELAQAYWGTYGPVHVWVLGIEGEGSIDIEARTAFLDEYCTWRTATTDRSISECQPHAQEMLIDVAERGDSEAYLSGVIDADPQKAELIFINVHKWFFETDAIPDPVLRGIHEYTHVFQLSIGVLPTWLVEGGAVFSESWIPSLQGRRNPAENMERIMERAHQITDPTLSIADMEDIDTASEPAAQHYLQLAYDSGAWAVAFMVHRSATQRVSSLRDEFYPLAKKVGWEDALTQYVRMQSKAEFYEAFQTFMDSPRDSQLLMLSELKQ